MGNLIENQELYTAIRSMIQTIHFEVHAIYGPGNNSFKPDWYCAAVDMFNPGMTFKLYFTLDENNKIHVEELSRWYFG